MIYVRNGVLVAAVLVTSFLMAQSTTQSIEGLVTDTSGAVIANAKVTITNTATGVTSIATSQYHWKLHHSAGSGRQL